MQTIVISQRDAPSACANNNREGKPMTPRRGLVDTVRQTVRHLVASEDEVGRELAVQLVEDHWRHLDAACPLEDDLRPWQLLASDLSVALEEVDPNRAKRATVLAEDMRSTITMMARNPKEELALRPASRRVLSSLAELGGRADAVRVREHSGHSATHLSNILKALRGHGLINLESAADDRRRKVLVLTQLGREEVARHGAAVQVDAAFSSGIALKPSGSNGELYRRVVRSAEVTA